MSSTECLGSSIYVLHVFCSIKLVSCVGLFSYLKVFFDMYGSLLRYECRVWSAMAPVSITHVFCIYQVGLVCRSLFICTGLFSYVQVSFHMYRSLFICTGLFSYVQVCFHMYRSLFICIGLFQRIIERVTVEYGVPWLKYL